MEPNVVASMVGSLGFPIVCCGALFWYVNTTMRTFTEKIETTMQSLSQTIVDNTTATSQLVTTVQLIAKIGGDSNV